MSRIIMATMMMLIASNASYAQSTPSYSKDIRPFLAKYCLECHNAKTLKGTLNLESHKAMMDGSDGGPVIKAGKPDESKLVRMTEHKDKPVMPPAKAKFQPTKDEIKLLRAWVMDGAKDDAVEVKVVLPAIKPKTPALAPVTAVAYSSIHRRLYFARQNSLTLVEFGPSIHSMQHASSGFDITALTIVPGSKRVIAGVSEPGKRGDAIAPGDGLEAIGIHALRHKDGLLDLVHHPKQPIVASASYDTEIHLTDLNGMEPTKQIYAIKEHSDAVYGLAFNPDGSQLASVSADRAMKVTDVKTGKLLYTLGEATDWLYTVAWSPNGKYLVSGGVDKSIRVYEPTLTGAKLRRSVFAHEGPVQKVVFSSDSKTLYSVGQDRVIKAWDIEKMVERKVYEKQPETVLCMALREDAGQIIIGRYDGIVQLIDMKTGKVAQEFGKEKKQAKPSAERSDSRASAPSNFQVSLPSFQNTSEKFNKNLDRAGAVHTHLINVTKGQSLGIRISKKVAASKFEPVLILTDDAGRIVADGYDGHLGHTFATAGKYTLNVRDREFRGGADFQYELEMGEIPIVTSVFPMGVQRRSKHTMELTGVFLSATKVIVDVPASARAGDIIPLDVGNGVLGKAQVVVSDDAETTIVGKISVPGTGNGRLTENTQKDVWTFDARKGQPLVVEVAARRLGSRLDSVIEILDANDQPVPRAVLRSQAKTHVTFRDHDSAQGNIRIEAWSELNTNDYLYVGNDLMKIQALPTHPDADCNFFATQGQRIGYLGTTPTHHANGEPMYKVTQHPPGTTFPPNGFPVFTIYYRNDDGGPGYGRDSRLLFDPPADGTYKVRIADARGMGGVNFGYRLTVRPPSPHFKLTTTPANPVVSKGGSIPITITADRIDGYDGPIWVAVKNLPAGLHLPTTTIEAGTYSTTVALFADAQAILPAKAMAQLEGSTFKTGLPYSFSATFNLPKLVEPGDLVTTVKESTVAIQPGAQAKMTVTIERRNGFKGRVPLEVKGLPHGVRVLDIGLNGILINENETTRTVVIYAEPWVQAMDQPFVVLAKREGTNSEHGAKSVLLEVK